MKIENLKKRVSEVESKAWANDEKEAAKLLHELNYNLEVIVSNIYWLEQAIENARKCDFNELGNLQSAAREFDIAVAKAAMLLKLLPAEVQEELEVTNA